MAMFRVFFFALAQLLATCCIAKRLASTNSRFPHRNLDSRWNNPNTETVERTRCLSPSQSWAIVSRGGSTQALKLKEAPLSTKRSFLGTFVLMIKTFFESFLDPTFGLAGAEEGGGGDGADDANPFASRDSVSSKTITVDKLGKLGGASAGKVRSIASESDFKKYIAAAGSKLVVVDFYATWCGPCKQIAPKFAELSGDYGTRVKFAKVDVDTNKPLSSKYGVSSMPTFLFLKNGKQVDKLSGASIDAIKQKITDLSR